MKTLNVDYQRIQPQTQGGTPHQNWDQITQVMESGSAVLGSDSESNWDGKIKHDFRGSNFN